MPELPVLDRDAVLAAVPPAGGDRRHPRGVRPASPRRVGDAVEGLPREPAATATSARCRRAATGWRSSSGSRRSRGNPARGLPTVIGLLVVSDADDVRAARAARRGRGDRAAHGRGGGGRGRCAGRRRASVGDRRLRAARRVGGAVPGGRGLRAGRLLRPAARGGRRRSPPSSAGRAGSRAEAVARRTSSAA